MFEGIDATAMLATRDMSAARAFYADVLGFEVHDDPAGGIASFRAVEPRSRSTSPSTPAPTRPTRWPGPSATPSTASCRRSETEVSRSSDTTTCRA